MDSDTTLDWAETSWVDMLARVDCEPERLLEMMVAVDCVASVAMVVEREEASELTVAEVATDSMEEEVSAASEETEERPEERIVAVDWVASVAMVEESEEERELTVPEVATESIEVEVTEASEETELSVLDKVLTPLLAVARDALTVEIWAERELVVAEVARVVMVAESEEESVETLLLVAARVKVEETEDSEVETLSTLDDKVLWAVVTLTREELTVEIWVESVVVEVEAEEREEEREAEREETLLLVAAAAAVVETEATVLDRVVKALCDTALSSEEEVAARMLETLVSEAWVASVAAAELTEERARERVLVSEMPELMSTSWEDSAVVVPAGDRPGNGGGQRGG